MPSAPEHDDHCLEKTRYRSTGYWSRHPCEFNVLSYNDAPAGKVVLNLPKSLHATHRSPDQRDQLTAFIDSFWRSSSLLRPLGYEVRTHQVRLFLRWNDDERNWIAAARRSNSQVVRIAVATNRTGIGCPPIDPSTGLLVPAFNLDACRIVGYENRRQKGERHG